MTLVSERIGQFFSDGHRLEYTEYGAGDRWVVLLPAHLMPRRMHRPLATELAAAGAHVVTLDPLGHGRSDRPVDPFAHAGNVAAAHVVDLLDHLGAPSAVLGGTSIGANTALEAAVLAPDRVRGLLLEAPVLENGLQAWALKTVPLLVAARSTPYAVSGLRMLTRAVPRGIVPFWTGVALDVLDQRPAAMAASLHGRLGGRLAPTAPQRRDLEVPALVVGFRGDPWHPEADAMMLADELTAAQYLRARGPWEWRLRPGRLDRAAQDFVATCWEEPVGGRLAQASS